MMSSNKGSIMTSNSKSTTGVRTIPHVSSTNMVGTGSNPTGPSLYEEEGFASQFSKDQEGETRFEAQSIEEVIKDLLKEKEVRDLVSGSMGNFELLDYSQAKESHKRPLSDFAKLIDKFIDNKLPEMKSGFNDNDLIISIAYRKFLDARSAGDDSFEGLVHDSNCDWKIYPNLNKTSRVDVNDFIDRFINKGRRVSFNSDLTSAIQILKSTCPEPIHGKGKDVRKRQKDITAFEGKFAKSIQVIIKTFEKNNNILLKDIYDFMKKYPEKVIPDNEDLLKELNNLPSSEKSDSGADTKFKTSLGEVNTQFASVDSIIGDLVSKHTKEVFSRVKKLKMYGGATLLYFYLVFNRKDKSGKSPRDKVSNENPELLDLIVSELSIYATKQLEVENSPFKTFFERISSNFDNEKMKCTMTKYPQIIQKQWFGREDSLRNTNVSFRKGQKEIVSRLCELFEDFKKGELNKKIFINTNTFATGKTDSTIVTVSKLLLKANMSLPTCHVEGNAVDRQLAVISVPSKSLLMDFLQNCLSVTTWFMTWNDKTETVEVSLPWTIAKVPHYTTNGRNEFPATDDDFKTLCSNEKTTLLEKFEKILNKVWDPKDIRYFKDWCTYDSCDDIDSNQRKNPLPSLIMADPKSLSEINSIRDTLKSKFGFNMFGVIDEFLATSDTSIPKERNGIAKSMRSYFSNPPGLTIAMSASANPNDLKKSTIFKDAEVAELVSGTNSFCQLLVDGNTVSPLNGLTVDCFDDAVTNWNQTDLRTFTPDYIWNLTKFLTDESVDNFEKIKPSDLFGPVEFLDYVKRLVLSFKNFTDNQKQKVISFKPSLEFTTDKRNQLQLTSSDLFSTILEKMGDSAITRELFWKMVEKKLNSLEIEGNELKSNIDFTRGQISNSSKSDNGIDSSAIAKLEEDEERLEQIGAQIERGIPDTLEINSFFGTVSVNHHWIETWGELKENDRKLSDKSFSVALSGIDGLKDFPDSGETKNLTYACGDWFLTENGKLSFDKVASIRFRTNVSLFDIRRMYGLNINGLKDVVVYDDKSIIGADTLKQAIARGGRDPTRNPISTASIPSHTLDLFGSKKRSSVDELDRFILDYVPEETLESGKTLESVETLESGKTLESVDTMESGKTLESVDTIESENRNLDRDEPRLEEEPEGMSHEESASLNVLTVQNSEQKLSTQSDDWEDWDVEIEGGFNVMNPDMENTMPVLTRTRGSVFDVTLNNPRTFTVLKSKRQQQKEEMEKKIEEEKPKVKFVPVNFAAAIRGTNSPLPRSPSPRSPSPVYCMEVSNSSEIERRKERRKHLDRTKDPCRHFQNGCCKSDIVDGVSTCNFSHDPKYAPKEPVVCMEHINGNCKFGRKCRDIHLCRHHLKGTCTWENCKFSHAIPEGFVMPKMEKQQKVKPSTQPQFIDDNSSVASSTKSTQDQVCRHFLNGCCKFGDRCKFVHKGVAPNGIPTSRLCTHHMNGVCSNGINCPYFHPNK